MSLQAYIDEAIAPHADRWDLEERIPRTVLHDLAGQGLLGASVPADQGGTGRSAVAWGEALESIGAASLKKPD